MSRVGLVALVALVASTAAVAGFFVWRVNENVGDPVRLVTILDSVPLPSSWQGVRTDSDRSFITGASAHRYFLIDADPEDAVLIVKDAVEAAGFTIERRFAPINWCFQEGFGAIMNGSPLPSVIPTDGPCPTKENDCTRNGRDGPLTCTVSASRDRDQIFVSLNPRGTTSSDIGSGSATIGDPNLSLVVMRTRTRAPSGLIP